MSAFLNDLLTDSNRREGSHRSGEAFLVISRRTAKRAPDECGGSLRPARRGWRTGELAGIPSAGAEGDGDLEVGISVDQALLASTLENRPQAASPRRHHALAVARAQFRLRILLEHRSDQREAAWSRNAAL